jgi:peroxiredoxin
VLLGITAEKDVDKLQKFAQKQGLSYPILMGDWKIFKAYKVGGVPDIYYIDPEGKVNARNVGLKPDAEKNMESQIKKLLDMIKCDDEQDSSR